MGPVLVTHVHTRVVPLTPVFNLELARLHRYPVTPLGLRVHNDCSGWPAKKRGKATKGFQKQLEKHLKKLEDFKANPDKFDNKGFLKDASPELRQKIIDGRIRSLERQIENFRRQINRAGGGA